MHAASIIFIFLISFSFLVGSRPLGFSVFVRLDWVLVLPEAVLSGAGFGFGLRVGGRGIVFLVVPIHFYPSEAGSILATHPLASHRTASRLNSERQKDDFWPYLKSITALPPLLRTISDILSLMSSNDLSCELENTPSRRVDIGEILLAPAGNPSTKYTP